MRLIIPTFQGTLKGSRNIIVNKNSRKVTKFIVAIVEKGHRIDISNLQVVKEVRNVNQ